MDQPVAWLVVPPRGQPVPFIDHGRAVEYACKHHGVVVPLGALMPMPPINPYPVGR